MELLQNSPHALAAFIEQVASYNKPWWYGLNIPHHDDSNSIVRLVGLSEEESMLLFQKAGWVKKHGNARGKGTWAVSLDGVQAFLKRFHLTSTTEATKIYYRKKHNCLFIRIGQFTSGAPRFGPSSLGCYMIPIIAGIINHRSALRTAISTPPSSGINLTKNTTTPMIQQSKGKLVSFECNDEMGDRSKLDIKKQQPPPQPEDQDNAASAADDRQSYNIIAQSSDQATIAGTDVDLSNCTVFDANTTIKEFLINTIFPQIFYAKHFPSIKASWWIDTCDWSENVSESLIHLSQIIQKECDKKMSEGLGGSIAMTPNPSIKVPTLEKYGVDATNKTVLAKVMRDMYTIDDKRPKHKVLTTCAGNDRQLSGVRVPKSSSLERIRKNDYDQHWIEALIIALGTQNEWHEMNLLTQRQPTIPASVLRNDEEAIGSEDEVDVVSSATQLCIDRCYGTNKQPRLGNEAQDDEETNDGKEGTWSEQDVTARNLIHVLGSKYPKAFRWAVREHSIGVFKEPLDAVATFSMFSEANASAKQARVIGRHLRLWFGHQVVCGETKLKHTLIKQKIVPATCGIYKNNNEKIEWSVRDPVQVVLYYMNGIFNQRRTRREWNSVDLVMSCDHGKGFSRAHLVIICRTKDQATGQWSEYTESFGLAEAKCKKDTYTILKNTFMPALNKSFEQLIAKGGFDVWQRTTQSTTTGESDDEEERYYTLLQGEKKCNELDVLLFRNIPIEVFSAGDLSQLMTNFGRDGYSGAWCCFCDLSKSQWQFANHTKGNLWSVQRLRSHLALIANETDSRKRKGVRNEPILPAIDHSNNTLSTLHSLIGVGNCALGSLFDALQSTCEVYSINYVLTEKTYNKLIVEEKNAKIARDNYVQSTKLRLSGLKAMLKANKQETTSRQALELERNEIENTTTKLTTIKTKVTEQVRRARKAFLEEAANPFNSKAEGQIMRAEVEDICKKHGVNKGCFFGGDLQGPACRTLMQKRQVIFHDIWNYILALPDGQKLVDDRTIKEVLDAYERLFGHFDAVFSICSIKRHHVSEEQKTALEIHLKHAGAIWRAPDMSVTPKLHLLEVHCPEMMDRFDGLGDLGEDEGERGHQTGHLDQLRCRSLHHEAKTASILQFEAMSKDCRVKERQSLVKAATAKRKIQLVGQQQMTKKQKSKMVRDGERDSLLDYAIVVEKFPLLQNIRKEQLDKLNIF